MDVIIDEIISVTLYNIFAKTTNMAEELIKVVWTAGSFNPAEIMNTFKYDFPVLVKTNEDYKGNGDTQDIKKGTILCFSHIRIQKRAVAYDNNKRSLSIPLDYQFRFQVKTDSGFTRPKSLHRILHNFPLPVTLCFDSHIAGDICLSSSGTTPTRADQFGELVVKWVYREKLLQGAYIEGDADIYSNYMVMPCHFNIKMKVGKGIKGKTTEYWKTFRERFALHIDACSLPALQGSIHIYVFNGKTENENQIYANIQSSNYGLLRAHSVGANDGAIQCGQNHDSGFDDSYQGGHLSQRSSTGSQGSERMTSAPSSHERVSRGSHHSTHSLKCSNVSSNHGRYTYPSQKSSTSSGHGWNSPSSQRTSVNSSQRRYTDQRAAATNVTIATHPCGTDMTEHDEDDKHDYVNLDEQGRPLLPPDREGRIA